MTPWAYMSRVAEPAQKYHPVAILNQKPPRPKKLPPGSPERRLQRFGALLHDSTAARVGALFQLLVQDTTPQDFGLPNSAIRLRM